jgi:hypothetical protein
MRSPRFDLTYPHPAYGHPPPSSPNGRGRGRDGEGVVRFISRTNGRIIAAGIEVVNSITQIYISENNIGGYNMT